jgi:hypothetical protein
MPPIQASSSGFYSNVRQPTAPVRVKKASFATVSMAQRPGKLPIRGAPAMLGSWINPKTQVPRMRGAGTGRRVDQVGAGLAPGTSERDPAVLLRHSSLRKSQHCHSLDLRWLLGRCPDTPAATVSGGVQQQRAREGAAPGWGDISDTAPTRAWPARQGRLQSYTHCGSITCQLHGWPRSPRTSPPTTGRAANELMASPKGPNPMPPGS